MAPCGIHSETTFVNWHKSPFMILILPCLQLLPSTSSLPFPALDTSELCLRNMPTPSISSPLGLKGTTQALWEDSPDLPDCLSLSSNISLCPNIHQNWLGATRFRAPGTGPGAQETIHYCVSMNEWVREWLSEWVNKWVKGEEWKPLRTHSHRNNQQTQQIHWTEQSPCV